MLKLDTLRKKKVVSWTQLIYLLKHNRRLKPELQNNWSWSWITVPLNEYYLYLHPLGCHNQVIETKNTHWLYCHFLSSSAYIPWHGVQSHLRHDFIMIIIFFSFFRGKYTLQVQGMAGPDSGYDWLFHHVLHLHQPSNLYEVVNVRHKIATYQHLQWYSCPLLLQVGGPSSAASAILNSC